MTEVSFALQELALAEYGLGNLQQARQYTVEGLQTALEAGDTISLALNILPCALLLAQQGDTPRTAELWAMIADEPWITQSAIFEAARRKIKEAVAGLSIAEFEAACAKSQTLDLRAAVPRLLAELQTLGWSSAT